MVSSNKLILSAVKLFNIQYIILVIRYVCGAKDQMKHCLAHNIRLVVQMIINLKWEAEDMEEKF